MLSINNKINNMGQEIYIIVSGSTHGISSGGDIIGAFTDKMQAVDCYDRNNGCSFYCLEDGVVYPGGKDEELQIRI